MCGNSKRKLILHARTHTHHSSLIVDNMSTVRCAMFCVSGVWFIQAVLKYYRLYGRGIQSIALWVNRRDGTDWKRDGEGCVWSQVRGTEEDEDTGGWRN